MANGTLKVSNIETSSGSGTITIGQSGETISIPSGATVSGAGANTPAFSVTRTSNQSASSANAITKFQGNVENFDTDNAYDNSTNYRFTPQTAGKYFIYAKLYLDSSDHSATAKARSIIYKNGSLYTASQLDFRNNYGGYDNTVITQSIIDMNGSSDYVEAYFQIQVNSGTGLLAASTNKYNEFGGYRVIGA